MLALIGAALAGPMALGWELDTQLTDEGCRQSTLLHMRDQYDVAEQQANADWDQLSQPEREQWRTYLEGLRDQYDELRMLKLPKQSGDFDLCGPPKAYAPLAGHAQTYWLARNHVGFIRAVYVRATAASALEIDRLAEQVRADLTATYGAPVAHTVEATQWSTPTLQVEVATAMAEDNAALSVQWTITLDVSSAGYRASVSGAVPMGWGAAQVRVAGGCWSESADRLSPSAFHSLHAAHHALEGVDTDALVQTQRDAHFERVQQTKRALQIQARCTPPRYHPDLVQYWATEHEAQVSLHARTELDDADAVDQLTADLTAGYGAPSVTDEGVRVWTSPTGPIRLDSSGQVAELTIRYD